MYTKILTAVFPKINASLAMREVAKKLSTWELLHIHRNTNYGVNVVKLQEFIKFYGEETVRTYEHSHVKMCSINKNEF